MSINALRGAPHEKIPTGWQNFTAELREAVNSCLIETAEKGGEKESTHKIGGYDCSIRVVRGASESDVGSRDSSDTMGELRFVIESNPGAMFRVILDRSGSLTIDSFNAPYHDLVAPTALEGLQDDEIAGSALDNEDEDPFDTKKMPLNRLNLSDEDDIEIEKQLREDRKAITPQEKNDFIKKHPILAHMLTSDTIVVPAGPIHTKFAKKIDDILRGAL